VQTPLRLLHILLLAGLPCAQAEVSERLGQWPHPGIACLMFSFWMLGVMLMVKCKHFLSLMCSVSCCSHGEVCI
jgi:hypothetical protein